MFHAKIILFALTTVFVHSVYSKALPSYIKPCKRNDPNINKCVREILANLRPRLLKGIPEFKVPPYDPLTLPKVVIDQGNSQAVSFKATFNNLKTFGASKTELKDIRIKLEPEPVIDMVLRIPHIRMLSDYEINGKFLLVPIQGKGRSDGNFTEITTTLKLTGKFVTKNGERYIEITNNKIDLDIKDARFYFENLFNGNKQLGDTTNQFINENFQEILKEIKPVIQETAGGIISRFMRNVFDKYSYDELFPPK